MKIFITILFFILATDSFSQCTLVINHDTIIIGQKRFVAGGDYKSNKPGYISNDRLLFECQYKTYTSDSIIPENIKNIVENYLNKRCGFLHGNSFKFEKVLVTNIDSIKEHGPRYLLRRNWYGVNRGRIKYHFEYSFFPEKNIVYAFGISLNRKGKIISKNVIPELKCYDLTKRIKLCDSIEKIKEKYPAESALSIRKIKLIYDRNKNTFYYAITYSDVNIWHGHDGNNYYNDYTIKMDLFTGKMSKIKHTVGVWYRG
jgi:hypothetical protein